MPDPSSRSDPAPPRSLDRTPMAWRISAAALLIGGVAIGERLSGARTRDVLLPSLGIGSAATLSIALAGRRAPDVGRRVDVARPRASATAPNDLPRLDVLIPARDEAAALPRLIADLGRQDLRGREGCAAFGVIVIDDRSVDGTAEVARCAAARHGLEGVLQIVRRPPGSLPDGKGAALAAVPDDLLTGSAVVVLDADARMGPSFLREIAVRVRDGAPAFTVRRRAYHAGASLLAAAQAAELDLDALQLRARAVMTGGAEARGNGVVVTREALAAAGGWAPGSLTEDLELSTRLAVLGLDVAWVAEPVAWEAPAAGLRALGRQRVRWAEGSLRRLFRLLPIALASRRLRPAGKLDLTVYAGQALLPQLILGMLVGGVRRRRPGPLLAVLGTYVGVAVALSAAAADREAPVSPVEPAPGERAILARRSIRAVVGGAFSAQWLLAVPVALGRIALRPGPVRFERTRDRLL